MFLIANVSTILQLVVAQLVEHEILNLRVVGSSSSLGGTKRLCGASSVVFVSSAKHRHYEKMLKSSGKCFIYGKLVRNTNKVSLRFLLRDTIHEVLFTGHQEGNIIDNHS